MVQKTYPKYFRQNSKKKTQNDSKMHIWVGKEKRGMLNQFNEYLLENIENPFRINTIENYKNSGDSNEIPNISYIITLDADTDLSLNSE